MWQPVSFHSHFRSIGSTPTVFLFSTRTISCNNQACEFKSLFFALWRECNNELSVSRKVLIFDKAAHCWAQTWPPEFWFQSVNHVAQCLHLCVDRFWTYIDVFVCKVSVLTIHLDFHRQTDSREKTLARSHHI